MRVVPVSIAANEDEPISMVVPWIVRPASVSVKDEQIEEARLTGHLCFPVLSISGKIKPCDVASVE
jgi:hypothetical protein